MAQLTPEEIKEKAADAAEVGAGMENGLIVHQVHQGHIVRTYAETRKYPKKGKSDATQDK